MPERPNAIMSWSSLAAGAFGFMPVISMIFRLGCSKAKRNVWCHHTDHHPTNPLSRTNVYEPHVAGYIQGSPLAPRIEGPRTPEKKRGASEKMDSSAAFIAN